jgi:Mg2+ and Co2+ transporter CorA
MKCHSRSASGFRNSPSIAFDIREEYVRIMRLGGRTKDVLDKSINQHAQIIAENCKDYYEALDLVKLLEPDIKSRVKHYSYCISRSTDSYLSWIKEEYTRKLQQNLRARFN